MGQSYLRHLDRVSDDQTFRRKLEYLRFNFDADVGPGQTVLELGPGRGEFAAYARERGVAALDVLDRDPAVTAAMAARPGVRRAWTASAEELQVEQELGTYDRIVLLHLLEHVARPAAVVLLRRLYAHLAPGGRILATVPNGANPLSVVERYSDFTHETLYSEESLRQLVEICDLPGAAVAVRGFRIPPVDALNRLRIVAQKALHVLLRLVLVANGGVHFRLYHPNITLVVSRQG